MSIKYYHLAKGEKPPDEFCAVRDMGGEPSEYVFYVPESENAKLRDELAKARDPQRIGGQADPSSFVYAIEQLREFRWQHATNDEDAIPYINNVVAAHERENAKLRDELEDQEGYDQMLRDRLRQQTELCVKAESENAKLRELTAEMYPYAKAFLQQGVMLGCTDSKSYDWYLQLHEMGIEADE